MDFARIIEGANSDIIVVSQEEGAWLGVLSGARLEAQTKMLTGVLFRRNGARFLVPMAAIEVLGQDAILVGSRKDAREITEAEEIPGRTLMALRDTPVTTQMGERLGLLHDVRFDRQSGKLSTILLDEERALDVDPEEVTVGRDEVLVPSECSSRVREARAGEVGLLERMSTGSVFGDVVTGVRRVVSKTARGRLASGASAASDG